ncbi:MAG: diphosphate--fructose-6-phosphate 1-phosphotransferase [Chloroflexota bacterium]|nr:diphosphate--fructose-6-phosphate 1-phosphotransferase [Chloroflexota bacterium]
MTTLLVGQSGGATAVINASLIGVVEGALATARFDRILGMRHGIEGLLAGQFVDLGRLPAVTLDALRQTPSAALGTSRHKVSDADLDQILAVLRDHEVRAFILIGGNDSADTAHRLHLHATAVEYELAVISVPKTVDNDLAGTDHCPGYGSMARFISNAARDTTYDTLAAPKLYSLKFLEVMGRDAGWVAASTALGFSGDDSALAPLLCLPERPPASVDTLLAAVEAMHSARGWAVVVVPETLRDAEGRHLGGETPAFVDAFGHPYFASPGAALVELAAQRLGVQARLEKPGGFARMAFGLASPVDLDEAYRTGWAAAWRAAAGESDLMIALNRLGDDPYVSDETVVPLADVANQARVLPDAFIGPDGQSVTAAFRRYALPLLGPDALPPYARLME